jgi:SEFIR domain
MPKPCVFVSYRRENEEHCVRVRELAAALLDAGLKVIHDELACENEFHSGAPPDGWANWCGRQAETAPAVLVVASAGWFARLNRPGNNARSRAGLGAAFEASTVQTRFSNDGSVNTFLAFAYFDEELDLSELPTRLEVPPRFNVTDAKDFQRLIKYLTHIGSQPAPNFTPPPSGVQKPPPSNRTPAPPAVTRRPVSQQKSVCNIWLLRPNLFNAWLTRPDVVLDGRMIGSSVPGTRMRAEVGPGTHRLEIRSMMGFIVRELTFTMGDSDIYVLLELRTGLATTYFEPILLDSAAGAAEAAKYSNA